MDKFFAWQWGLKGPTPVVFHNGLPRDCATGRLRDEDLLDTVKLPSDCDASLDQLAAIYPLKENYPLKKAA